MGRKESNQTNKQTKGVFNFRPPSVKLLPEWDLKVVLDALQKPPFEPLKQADLKFVTYKTNFL